MNEPMRRKPATGTLMVLVLTVGGLTAALLALKFRVLEPRAPASQPAATLPAD